MSARSTPVSDRNGYEAEDREVSSTNMLYVHPDSDIEGFGEDSYMTSEDELDHTKGYPIWRCGVNGASTSREGGTGSSSSLNSAQSSRPASTRADEAGDYSDDAANGYANEREEEEEEEEGRWNGHGQGEREYSGDDFAVNGGEEAEPWHHQDEWQEGEGEEKEHDLNETLKDDSMVNEYGAGGEGEGELDTSEMHMSRRYSDEESSDDEDECMGLHGGEQQEQLYHDEENEFAEETAEERKARMNSEEYYEAHFLYDDEELPAHRVLLHSKNKDLRRIEMDRVVCSTLLSDVDAHGAMDMNLIQQNFVHNLGAPLYPYLLSCYDCAVIKEAKQQLSQLQMRLEDHTLHRLLERHGDGKLRVMDKCALYYALQAGIANKIRREEKSADAKSHEQLIPENRKRHMRMLNYIYHVVRTNQLVNGNSDPVDWNFIKESIQQSGSGGLYAFKMKSVAKEWPVKFPFKGDGGEEDKSAWNLNPQTSHWLIGRSSIKLAIKDQQVTMWRDVFEFVEQVGAKRGSFLQIQPKYRELAEVEVEVKKKKLKVYRVFSDEEIKADLETREKESQRVKDIRDPRARVRPEDPFGPGPRERRERPAFVPPKREQPRTKIPVVGTNIFNKNGDDDSSSDEERRQERRDGGREERARQGPLARSDDVAHSEEAMSLPPAKPFMPYTEEGEGIGFGGFGQNSREGEGDGYEGGGGGDEQQVDEYDYEDEEEEEEEEEDMEGEGHRSVHRDSDVDDSSGSGSDVSSVASYISVDFEPPPGVTGEALDRERALHVENKRQKKAEWQQKIEKRDADLRDKEKKREERRLRQQSREKEEKEKILAPIPAPVKRPSPPAAASAVSTSVENPMFVGGDMARGGGEGGGGQETPVQRQQHTQLTAENPRSIFRQPATPAPLPSAQSAQLAQPAQSAQSAQPARQSVFSRNGGGATSASASASAETLNLREEPVIRSSRHSSRESGRGGGRSWQSERTDQPPPPIVESWGAAPTKPAPRPPSPPRKVWRSSGFTQPPSDRQSFRDPNGDRRRGFGSEPQMPEDARGGFGQAQRGHDRNGFGGSAAFGTAPISHSSPRDTFVDVGLGFGQNQGRQQDMAAPAMVSSRGNGYGDGGRNGSAPLLPSSSVYSDRIQAQYDNATVYSQQPASERGVGVGDGMARLPSESQRSYGQHGGFGGHNRAMSEYGATMGEEEGQGLARPRTQQWTRSPAPQFGAHRAESDYGGGGGGERQQGPSRMSGGGQPAPQFGAGRSQSRGASATPVPQFGAGRFNRREMWTQTDEEYLIEMMCRATAVESGGQGGRGGGGARMRCDSRAGDFAGGSDLSDYAQEIVAAIVTTVRAHHKRCKRRVQLEALPSILCAIFGELIQFVDVFGCEMREVIERHCVEHIDIIDDHFDNSSQLRYKGMQ